MSTITEGGGDNNLIMAEGGPSLSKRYSQINEESRYSSRVDAASPGLKDKSTARVIKESDKPLITIPSQENFNY